MTTDPSTHDSVAHYRFSRAKLRSHVDTTEVSGAWRELAPRRWQFECDDGVVLYHDRQSRKLVFTGPPEHAARFRARLLAAVRIENETIGDYSGDIVGLMQDVNATAIPGTWQMKPYLVWRYRTTSGALLIWDQATGQLAFKGRPSAALTLERKLLEVILAEQLA